MQNIHPDWNTEKVEAHLADLMDSRDTAQAIHDFLTNEAEDQLRTIYRLAGQIAHCEDQFSKPRVDHSTPTKETK